MRLPHELSVKMFDCVQQFQIKEWDYTGSREICPSAAKETSDYDVVCLCDGFPSGTEPYDTTAPFCSLKYKLSEGELNLIITNDEKFFEAWRLATLLAKRLRLTWRDDRVAVFQAILYGRCVEQSSESRPPQPVVATPISIM